MKLQETLKDAYRFVRQLTILTKTPRQFAIETQGTEFVVWFHSAKGVRKELQKTEPLPLTVESLKTAFVDLEYHGQPLTIILHPPCVCLKTFQVGTNNPGQWLASHLAEIAPPGNRRDQVMTYQYGGNGQLQIAFARRRFLLSLGELLSGAGVSVQQVYVGGAVAGAFQTNWESESGHSQIDYSLCSYTITRSDTGTEIYPVLSHTNDLISAAQQNSSREKPTPSDDRTRIPATRLLKPESNSTSLKKMWSEADLQMDFRSQLDIPIPFPIRVMQSAVRIAFALLTCVLVILALHSGTKSILGLQPMDSSYQAEVNELRDIQQENRLLVSQLDHALQGGNPRFAAGSFLKAVALATPNQSWLTSLTLASSASNSAANFGLIGFSLDGDDPLRFADSLRSNRNMQSVAVTKGLVVESAAGKIEDRSKDSRLSKFEITGQYANE